MTNEPRRAPGTTERPTTAELLRRGLGRSIHEPYTGATPPVPSRPMPADEHGYSGTQAARVIGITFRQLDYFARTELVPTFDRQR